MDQIKIEIALQPKQLNLYDLVRNSKYKMIGYGGSNGGAKSHGIRDVNALLCLEEKKHPDGQKYNIKTLIFRRLSNDLLENHIIPFFQKYPALEKYFNKTERMIYWPNGDTTKFGSADREQDVHDFEGKEYDYIFIDEATLCTQYMIEFLKTRNRSGNVRAKMIFTMIPGFVGHTYIKRLFVDKNYLDYENPDDYVYLPARVWDNVIWSETALKEQGFTVNQYYNQWTEEQRRAFTLKYSDYALNLMHLPEQKRKARLFGDWEIFEGQFFEDWNPDVHVIQEKDYLPYNQLRKLKILGGQDYGNVTALYLGAKDYNDNVVVFDELYFEKELRSEKIIRTKEFLTKRGMEKDLIVSDTNMWVGDAFDKADQLSPAMEYIKAGIRIIPVSKASPKNIRYRVACNDAIKDALHYVIDENTGLLIKHPKLKIYARCKNLIRTFPALVTSDIDPEDIAKGQEDHCYDGMKYFYMAIRSPKEAEEDTRPEWVKKQVRERKKRTKKNFMAA